MKNTNSKRKAVKIMSRGVWILLVLIAMAGVARTAIAHLTGRQAAFSESWTQP